MNLNASALRARFAELAQNRADAIDVSAPLRDKRDQVAREAQTKIEALDAQIRDAEDGLFDLDQEAALISRALGGKTGETEATDEA